MLLVLLSLLLFSLLLLLLSLLLSLLWLLLLVLLLELPKSERRGRVYAKRRKSGRALDGSVERHSAVLNCHHKLRFSNFG